MSSTDGRDYGPALRKIGLCARTGSPVDALAQLKAIPCEVVPEHLVLYLVNRCECLGQWTAVRDVLDFAGTLSLSERTRRLFGAKRAIYADDSTRHPGLDPVVDAGYQILETIFSGSRASILKARDAATGELVAVKLSLDPGTSASALRTEGQILSRLAHPNVIGFKCFLQGERGACAIVLEFVDGKTLKDLLTSCTEPLSLASATEIALALASGLEYLHGHGIVHHDIKPSNLMLDSEKSLKIIDFGIACSLGSDGDTRAGGGTARYMAPEKKHSRASDHRADIYSFGLVMCDLLSLVKPQETNPPKPAECRCLHREVCDGLQRLAQQCSHPDPEERLHCMGRAKRDLLEAQAAIGDS